MYGSVSRYEILQSNESVASKGFEFSVVTNFENTTVWGIGHRGYVRESGIETLFWAVRAY